MKRFFNQKGLTLIEIIVTLAVLGVVITPLMSMFVTSQKVNVESRKEYEALQLAQKYMEEIKAMDTISIGTFNTGTYGEDEGIGIFTWNEKSDDDKYDLVIKVKGVVGDEEESGPAEIIFDDDKTINSNDNITVTNESIVNIRRKLGKDNLIINISNLTEDTVNLYIYSVEGENYTAKEVNVLKGSVRVIKNEATELKPDNLLYVIEITVERDSEEINTISGTTIFKYKPVKP